ncbi:phage holin family protein [Streptomyces sp. NPDC006733]|uniref:phage holin family protein n=1 Tax=Streptomyces sp. NPDC006733 TaxID=3155460 RepID=UPI003404EB65
MAMSNAQEPGPRAAGADSSQGASVGQLVSDITSDLSKLVHEEIELAKVEVKQETARAGKAAGLLGGAGYAGHLALLLGSLTAILALNHVMDLAWAALLVTAVWTVAGTALFAGGRKKMRSVQLKPERSIDSLKEDAQWTRHPTT